MWWAQGDLVDRSQEMLGRTDVPIVLLRRQLEEQIKLVEEGRDPMNFFPDNPGDILFGAGVEPLGWDPDDWTKMQLYAGGQSYRKSYHKGFAEDDADRYGPAMDLVVELHRRIAETGMFEVAENPGMRTEPA